MKTKQEKIKEWLLEHYNSTVSIVAFGGLHLRTYSYVDINGMSWENLQIVGIYKNKQLINIPEFEDDVEQPKDKALQEFYRGYPNLASEKMMQEINNRIKDLEAAVARLEAANDYP